MQYRTDTRSGNQLSALGFGCMRFHTRMGSIDLAQAEQLLRAAIDGGVNYLDTAYIYNGSEHALGQILSKDGLRDKVLLADKLPLMLCRSGADFDRLLSKQLDRLCTDHIDYYLMHNLSSLAAWERLCGFGIEDWLRKQRERGAIRQIGFSFHGGREDFSALLDAYDWDFVQIQYNYIDEHNQAGIAGLRKAAEKGLPIIVMEPLLGGKLAKDLPPAAAQAFHAADAQRTPAEWALRWLWDQPEVTVVLSGMNSPAQLEENLRIAGAAQPGMLTDAEHAVYRDVLEAFNAAFKVRCTGCNYCMPCPQGVNIPGCFAAYNKSVIKRLGSLQEYMFATGAIGPKQHFASQCTRCGACERHCPQSIPIREKLAETARAMEPFWFKPGTAIARRVMGLRRHQGTKQG